MPVLPKYLASRIVATIFILIQIESTTMIEALVGGKNNKRHPAKTALSASQLRRSFLVTLSTNGLLFLQRTTISSACATALPRPNAGGDPASIQCRPPEKLEQKLSDTRAQIDMAVQASSVQAFSSAAELANDPLLDASSLEALIAESCKSSSNSQSRDLSGGVNGVISEILQSVEKMRSTLKKPTILTTEEVKDVMRYGTTARSAIDSIFAM